MKAFAEQICKAYPNASAIHWILDNARYHKSDEILKFIETTKIKIIIWPHIPQI